MMSHISEERGTGQQLSIVFLPVKLHDASVFPHFSLLLDFRVEQRRRTEENMKEENWDVSSVCLYHAVTLSDTIYCHWWEQLTLITHTLE